jgi:hypothetical protein
VVNEGWRSSPLPLLFLAELDEVMAGSPDADIVLD